MLKDLSKLAFLVVKDFPNGVNIGPGDIIKFGRVPYLIKERGYSDFFFPDSSKYKEWGICSENDKSDAPEENKANESFKSEYDSESNSEVHNQSVPSQLSAN